MCVVFDDEHLAAIRLPTFWPDGLRDQIVFRRPLEQRASPFYFITWFVGFIRRTEEAVYMFLFRIRSIENGSKIFLHTAADAVR